MRFFGAILVVAALILSISGNATAAPPKGAGKDGKQGLIKPPPKGVSRAVGVLVKSEPAEGSHRWLTIVLTQINTGTTAIDAETLLLEPFRISCLQEGTDFPLGHRLEAWCHLGGPEPETPGHEGNQTMRAIAAVKEFGEKVEASEQPDFDLMTKVLKDAISNESRSLVVDVLVGIPGKRSSRALATAIYDISLPIRLKAARELIARDYEPALEKLTAMLLMDIESEITFQIDLAEELAAAGHKEGTEYLLRHIGDAKPEIAIAAIRALARTGGADEAAQLEALAKSASDENVAQAAREAVEEIKQRLGGE